MNGYKPEEEPLLDGTKSKAFGSTSNSNPDLLANADPQDTQNGSVAPPALVWNWSAGSTSFRSKGKRRRSSIIENVCDIAEAVDLRALEHAADLEEQRSAIRRSSSRRRSSFISDEAGRIRDAFVDELKDAGRRHSHFVETTVLTRNISVLPEDIFEAAEAVAREDDDEKTDSFDTEKQPLHGTPEPEAPPFKAYILLATAVLALSSIGPLLNVQDGVDATLKVFWRTCATAVVLFPFGVLSIVVEGPPKLSLHQVFEVIITSVAFAASCVAFVVALDYTTVGNAVIFCNAQSLILLVCKLFVGDRVSLLEGGGAIVAFIGAVLCSKDSAEGSDDTSGDKTVIGDLVALGAGVGGIIYLVVAKTVRPHINILLFMFLMMALGSVIILLFMIMIGLDFSYGIDIDNGLWGWMNIRGDRLPLELCMVLFCNIFGAMGYVRAMRYFSNLVISVAALMEPVVAVLTAFALGVGVLPGALGWLGNVLVAVGTFAVVLPTPETKKTEDTNEG